MPFVRGRDTRTSLRLPHYDYSTPGAYFVTICVDQRRCVLGAVSGGLMNLSDAGGIAERAWTALADRFPSLALDTYVIMPNHLHGIIHLAGARFIAPVPSAPDNPGSARHTTGDPVADGLPGTSRYRANAVGGAVAGAAYDVGADGTGAMNRAPTGALGEVVRAFKAAATRQIRLEADPTFAWQRNYFERVLRDEESLTAARKYITENPAKWARDPERTR
jgi:REP element-mobilizing transposase RayT